MAEDKSFDSILAEEVKNIEATLIEPLVKEQVAGMQSTPLKTVEQQIQEVRNRYKESFEKSLELIQKSSKEVLNDPKVGIVFPPNYKEAVKKLVTEMKAIEAAIKAEEYDKLPEEMPTLQKALNISADTIEKLYQTIYACYQKGDYEAATRRCLFAINLNAAMPNFWSMMAICEEKQEHWIEAASAYLMAATLDPLDAAMHVGAIRCLCLCNQGKTAEAADYGKQILDFYTQNNNKEEAALIASALSHFKLG
jgi:tetratricopeptide (TPR) repeat protein